MNRTRLMKTCTVRIVVLSLMALGCGGGPSPEADVVGHLEGDDHAIEQGDQGDEREDPDEAHGEEGIVRMDEAALARLGLEIAEAGPGDIKITVELPGEVRVNGDRMAHVGPRVGGVAQRVLVRLGDTVRTGQLLAVIESRELADSKATYLAAAERRQLAEATFAREERLWRDKVSSEQDYLDARIGLAEAKIAQRVAEKKLHVLGFDHDEVQRLADEPDIEYASYRITAPFGGEVVDRHITIGETIPAEQNVFTIADLSSVWIDLSVYQKDLATVSAGQNVWVRPANNGVEGSGTIEFVQPLLGEDTRTALARLTMPNPGRRWKPGLFVTANVVVDAANVAIRVPRTALIRMEDGDDVVFVQTDEGFEPRPVTLGRTAPDAVEVVGGLEPGDRYVAAGGFSLKAELGKDAFGDGHGH
jgi:cobalt-zinc-cadmium efflux system membrane fusion protein